MSQDICTKARAANAAILHSELIVRNAKMHLELTFMCMVPCAGADISMKPCRLYMHSNGGMWTAMVSGIKGSAHVHNNGGMWTAMVSGMKGLP